MPAKSPEEICRLFKQHMAEGNIDSVLSVYDPEAVFLNQSGEVKKGEEDLRQERPTFAAEKATYRDICWGEDTFHSVCITAMSPDRMTCLMLKSKMVGSAGRGPTARKQMSGCVQPSARRKIAGKWSIVHAHESVPFYMDGSYRAAVDLKP